MNKYHLKIYLAIGILVFSIISAYALQHLNQTLTAWKPLVGVVEQSEHQVGYVVNIKDDEGNLISMACRGVSSGDEIINSEGKKYRITSVRGSEAKARFIGTDKQFLAYNDYYSNMVVPVASTSIAAKEGGRNVIGIYHTHSAESYVPTDGIETIPFKGGIYQVGQTLVSKLKTQNLEVNYDRTPHDPHDNNAYYRSRRTATTLMKSNTIALLDVHRDGIPDPNFYRKNISNEQVAQLRLVVGRQNPKMSSNLDFAKRMMAYANKVHPMIVKEIFIGRGNYNQDLMSTALLLEAGTHVNTKLEAQNGIALFADAIPTVLGLTPGGPGVPPAGAAETGGAWRALAWILALAILGGGAFLLISSGGFSQAKSRLSSFVSREFTGFIGLKSENSFLGMLKIIWEKKKKTKSKEDTGVVAGRLPDTTDDDDNGNNRNR